MKKKPPVLGDILAIGTPFNVPTMGTSTSSKLRSLFVKYPITSSRPNKVTIVTNSTAIAKVDLFNNFDLMRRKNEPNKIKEIAVVGAIGILSKPRLPQRVKPGRYEINPRRAIKIVTMETQ